MESYPRLNMDSETILKDAQEYKDNVLRINIELPVIPESFVLLGVIRRAEELYKATNKNVRLYSNGTIPMVEKIFYNLLDGHDNIFYTNEGV